MARRGVSPVLLLVGFLSAAHGFILQRSGRAILPLRLTVDPVAESSESPVADEAASSLPEEYRSVLTDTEPADMSGLAEQAMLLPVNGAGASLARKDAVMALTSALSRSLDRTSAVKGMLAVELKAVRLLLDAEKSAEIERIERITSLTTKLDEAVQTKTKTVEQETALLHQIQDLQDQCAEKVIKAKFEKAAGDKAGLVSIELVICETMQEISGQLGKEREVAKKRLASMEEAWSSLPLPEDGDLAVGQYGFQELVDLQDFIRRTEQEAMAADEKIVGLKNKISSALRQRNELLGLPAPSDPGAAVAPIDTAATSQPVKGVSPKLEFNEVQYLQHGGANAAVGLLNLAKAVKGVVVGEETVGDDLRRAGKSLSIAVDSFVDAGKKLQSDSANS